MTATKVYDPNCIRCRYARPGATTTHADHVPDEHADVEVLADGTLRITGR